MRPPPAIAAAVLGVVAAGARGLAAQQDTVRATVLDTVVVTAERAPTALATVSTAVTRIGAERLARVPHATFADLLRLAPGIAQVDFDGMGMDPQLMVRGFYGGGQAEYVVVLLDGRPLHLVHSGLVAWDALPPVSAIEAVEIARGSTSALYGDAAVGAVVNIITRPPAARRPPSWRLWGGAHDSWRGSADLAGTVFGRPVSIGGGADHTAGFRAHAGRTAGRMHARVQLRDTEDHDVFLSVRSHWRAFDEPGPLLDSILAVNRRASDPLFRFDHTRDQDYAVGLSARRAFGAGNVGSVSLTAERRHVTAKRTLALAPGFGDTKERATTNGRFAIALQVDLAETPMPGADHLTVGTDVSRGSSDSRYYAVLTGDRDAYRAASGERDSLEAAGDAGRDVQALFAQWSVQPTAAVRLTLGGRFDLLNDMFGPRPAGDTTFTSHKAFSPKAGLNVRYLHTERASGNVYVTASRSFKAPTLDQLFDQRSIPVPFPPFTVTTSNDQLEPQYGTSVEAGLYHRSAFGGTALLTATFSVYQTDMKDEIDFDVATLRYVNIGRSRHKGIEAGVTLSGLGPASAFANYTLQDVTARSGASAGNALKAVPKHAWTAGLGVTAGATIDARLILSHARDIYLDDANTVRLPPHTRVDASLAYRAGPVDIFLDAMNLFGARFNSTGFLDPSGSGAAYYHPAAERVLSFGVRSGP